MRKAERLIRLIRHRRGPLHAAVSLPRWQVLAFALTLSGLGGCAPLAQQDTLRDLETDMSLIRDVLQRNENQLEQIRIAQGELDAPVTEQLADLQGNLSALGTRVDRACRNLTPVQSAPLGECPEPGRKVVVTETGKVVLGEVERVWLDPPGIQLLARTDTGASSSSLHAAEITEFERDGDDWVRFEMRSEDENMVIERAVMKYVRVFQQADKKGSRRPVVEMRIHLGDVQGTFEFTLADRSHLQHDMILGRNFLTDMALVDVSRQFVQPQSIAQQRFAKKQQDGSSAEAASEGR